MTVSTGDQQPLRILASIDGRPTRLSQDSQDVRTVSSLLPGILEVVSPQWSLAPSCSARRRDEVPYQPLWGRMQASQLLARDQRTNPMVLSWQGVGCLIRTFTGEKRYILHDVAGLSGHGTDGTPSPGLLAIMGPSGAGKSTLLDLLSGRRIAGEIFGEISVDGHQILPAGMREITGYVLQELILPGTSTVREYLLFNASLRMPSGEGKRAHEHRVQQVVQLLGLQKVASSVIGDSFMRGISGGEKRRVSMAAELIRSPGVLFLDEPTTGLDSPNAGKVVGILADLGSCGVNVVTSIHQPRLDMFQKMDRMLLLSGRGETVYSGPTRDMEKHFGALGYHMLGEVGSTTHIADYMLDVLIRCNVNEASGLTDNYHLSQVAAEDQNKRCRTRDLARMQGKSDLPLKFRPGFGAQLHALSGRSLLKMVRHPFLVYLQYGAILGAALGIGAIFYETGYDTGGIQNRLGSLAFMLLYMALLSLSSLPVWREDRLLFISERATGLYGTPAYFATIVLFDIIPMRMVPPTFFAFFTYWMVGLRRGCGACMMWYIFVLVSSNCTSNMMCMALGAMTPSSSSGGAIANVLGSMVLMFFFLFGGFLLSKKDMGDVTKLVSNLSFFNYAYEALAVNEFGDPDRIYTFSVTKENEDQEALSFPCKGSYVLKEFGFDEEAFRWDVCAILLIFAAFALLTYVLLELCETGLAVYTKQLLLRFIFRQRSPSIRRLPPRLPSTNDLVREGESKNSLGMMPSTPDLNRIFDPVTILRISPSPLGPAGLPDASAGGAASGLSMPHLPPEASAARMWGTGMMEGMGMEEAVEVTRPVLSWAQLTYVVHPAYSSKPHTILHNVCGMAGAVARGDLDALLGPSGAGKSTLLDILAGRQAGGNLKGEVSVDGCSVTQSSLRCLTGYVLQDVVLPGTSTVMEYFRFQAMLRMPASTPPEEQCARSEAMLKLLGLVKVQHSRIGDDFVRGLSGGEKRRVSIGAELIKSPGILLLDEATTGLDSSNAAKVVDILAEVGRTGVTVLITIHQARLDMFRMMSRVTLLSGRGQLVYSGPSGVMDAHFINLGYTTPSTCPHPSEYIMELMSNNSAALTDALVAAYAISAVQASESGLLAVIQVKQAEGGTVSTLNVDRQFAASTWVQVKALLHRQSRNILRHPLLLYLHFVASFFIAWCVGLVYRDADKNTWGIQNRLGSLYFIVVYLAFMSLSSLPLWREERLLFLRERASGVYSTGAYFAAVVLFDIVPLRILPPLFFTFITYPLIGYASDSSMRPVKFSVTLILINVVSSSLNMAIGAAAPSNAVANVIGSIVALFMTLFSGFLINNQSLTVYNKWAADISYGHYAYEALVMNEFSNITGYRLTSYQPSQNTGIDVSGNEILETFGFHAGPNNSSEWWITDTLVLMGFTVVYLVATYLVLKLPQGGLSEVVEMTIAYRRSQRLRASSLRLRGDSDLSTPRSRSLSASLAVRSPVQATRVPSSPPAYQPPSVPLQPSSETIT
ncbi:hypothetical protein CYMTET_29063 [Cymbomonas tetramitiformis]|uniref:ABC transporter domain-containing protein n=1 Tax=Cymbomonas tetramitiformis TaxID=36881 RepID=A0AAE0FM70_9CHLO|nr:hypothetical protein CYMTET_29063 [Cymbomonas tetramitiformis]